MVVVQIGYAGMNIMSKLAMDTGMDPFIHVAYRQIFGTMAIAPFAYFLERTTRPKMTMSILFQIFLCSIFGVTVNQITYFVGLKNSTPTVACALSNITPAVTFIFAVPFGLESVGLKTKAGEAKVWGTIICVGGALLLSFYHGHILDIGQSSIHWKYAENAGNQSSSSTGTHGNAFLGPFLVIAEFTVSWAIWFIIQKIKKYFGLVIIQARLSKEYKAPYSSAALMCFMASFQCVIIGFLFNHDISSWELTPSIRATSTIYSGIVCTALSFCLMSWCLGRKGPLYVSVFSPLLLVIVAILSWAGAQEKWYIGTAKTLYNLI
ncbi:hypothetical protein Leryth_015008 [Lithospermum erythrorhizon]|nr:hypothetical protein Leryth_015008 [Lithospermum erythrorhizon]